MAVRKGSIKACLLNALVFPGVGHFAAKSKKKGFIFCFLAGFGTVALFASMLSRVQYLADQAVTLGLANDLIGLTMYVRNHLFDENASWIIASVVIIAGAWLASIVDSFFLGGSATSDHLNQA